jgi:hypothetical protein
MAWKEKLWVSLTSSNQRVGIDADGTKNHRLGLTKRGLASTGARAGNKHAGECRQRACSRDSRPQPFAPRAATEDPDRPRRRFHNAQQCEPLHYRRRPGWVRGVFPPCGAGIVCASASGVCCALQIACPFFKPDRCRSPDRGCSEIRSPMNALSMRSPPASKRLPSHTGSSMSGDPRFEACDFMKRPWVAPLGKRGPRPKPGSTRNEVGHQAAIMGVCRLRKG